MNNDDLLNRIDGAVSKMTTTDFGDSLLVPEQADRFIQVATEGTPMLSKARQLTMSSHTRNIDRIGFSGRILDAGTEGTQVADSADPTPATNKLVAQELVASVPITDDSLEDNIEREDFADTLRDLIARQVGVDLQRWAVRADTTNGANAFYKLTDGWLVKAGNAVAGAGDGTGDFDNTDVEAMFDALIGAIEPKFYEDRSAFTLWVPFAAEDDYRDVVRGRGTALGDSAQTGAGGLAYKGFPVQQTAAIPSGEALLAPNSNLVYGLHRNIRIETERSARKRTTWMVASLRADVNYENENVAAAASGYVGK